MSTKKTTTMEENIRNYSNEIVSLNTFVEAVRKVPGMYIGNKGNQGFLTMIKEIFQNAIDEVMRDSSPCDKVIISYDERTHTTIVEDNGRGIPFKDMIRIYTSQHTSANYNKKTGEYTSGVHGVGSKVTNALSSTFIVESYILGEARRVEFIDGVPKSDPEVIPNNNNRQGTMVMFNPCYEIMGNLTLKVQDVYNLVKGILPLTKIGTIFEFNGIHLDGSQYHETLINQDGIITDLIMKTINPLIKPVIYSNDTGTMRAEIAFTFDSNDLQDADITSFANFCHVTDGKHLEGFEQGICNFFRNYMNRIYLANNKSKKISIINNDVKVGLKAIVTVSHLNPIFTGQAKERLGNEDMLPFVRDLTLSSLNAWSKENPQDLQKICKYLKGIAEIRLKSEEGKIKLSSKYKSSSVTGLPSKYDKPTGTKNLEFLIVEGDSAKGSARNSKCHKRQGLFPIRGKLPNAFTTEKSKFLENEEIAALITLIGGGYGKNFDLSQVKWEKIIFMADADPDGKHIRSLLLKFFLLYMPELIEDGRVYSAVPPLYGLERKKGSIYFTNRLDYVMYCQKQFSKNVSISSLRGNKLSSKEITDLLYANVDYVYDLEILSNRYAVNPHLLELIFINIDKDVATLNAIVSDKFRFMKVYTKGNSILVEGLIESKYQTLFINQHFLQEIKDIRKYTELNKSMYYNVNNEVMSLYSIMKLYESSTPAGIARYKGLGEMDPEQLAESTMHPDSPYRTLLRYTLESAKEEIETIRFLESNRNELIKDVKVSRIDLL